MNANNDYVRHYKMLRFIMSQTAVWKRFSRLEKLGPAVVQLGLKGVKAALYAVPSSNWRSDEFFFKFVKEWALIFGCASCDNGKHLMVEQRFGVLLFFVLHKFIRLMDVHSTRRFGHPSSDNKSVTFASFGELCDEKQRSLVKEFSIAFRNCLIYCAQNLFIGFTEYETLNALKFHFIMLGMEPCWELANMVIIEPAQEREANVVQVAAPKTQLGRNVFCAE